jgi:bifunctional UDP-N-acetylglucosamine pyrophosphorylase/glucosamine-1-phosphate N-acetyltransferase
MGHLTENIPKPMLQVCGKNLIEYKLEALPKSVTSVILVVGYKKEVITEYFGDSWNGIAISYVTQDTLDGTGGAMKLCEELLQNEDRFLVLMGDDIYDKEDIEALASSRFSILVSDQGEAGRTKGWQVFFDSQTNQLLKINQHTEEETSPYINAGAYSLGKEYFSAEPYKMDNGEYSLPNTLLNLISSYEHGDKDKKLSVKVVVAKKWIQITDPETLTQAENIFR